jgi:hypothetical protein
MLASPAMAFFRDSASVRASWVTRLNSAGTADVQGRALRGKAARAAATRQLKECGAGLASSSAASAGRAAFSVCSTRSWQQRNAYLGVFRHTVDELQAHATL